MNAITVANSSGVHAFVVLRRWVDDHAASNDDPVRREAAILRALEPTDLAAPRLIASDPTGEESGGSPSVLMTLLPGRMYLEAADRNKWLHRIATCLSEIHALEIETPPYTPWYDLNLLAPPPSTSRAQLWHRAIDIVRNELPVAELGFIHRDFQHFNLLWRHRKISGIVDWVFASTGPREIDVGHCRLNLALLFSADVAERFRLIYESESGRETDPRWDLAALIGYLTGRSHLVAQQAGRFAVVDQLGMNERIEETVRAAIARM